MHQIRLHEAEQKCAMRDLCVSAPTRKATQTEADTDDQT